MRIKKDFAQRTRTRDSDEVKRKYFFVFEGDETEVQYFEGIDSIKKELGISALIEIRPIIRSYNEMGWTNPKKLLDRVIEYIDGEKDDITTVKELTDRVIDFLIEDGGFIKSIYTPDVVYNIITDWLFRYKGTGERSGIRGNEIEEYTKEISRCLKKEMKLEKNLEKISEYLYRQNITYEEGFDKVCLIVDRDRGSFVAYPHNDQYEYVRQKCEEKGFGFYISNPCFEFWLMLHFDEVFDYDTEVLLENPKITNKIRYLENELRKFLPGYRKSHIRFSLLRERIDRAIKNEKHFCEDVCGLKNEVGSNIGTLIEELRKCE